MTGASRNALRTGAVLFLFALVGTAILAFTHDRTEPVITRSKEAEKLALIDQVLPATLYDNDLLASMQTVPPDDLLGTRQPSSLWIARRGKQVTAVVLEAIAPDGYAGDIALLIGPACASRRTVKRRGWATTSSGPRAHGSTSFPASR